MYILFMLSFVMQEHKTGIWPYKYRILLRENSKEIANVNDLYTIQMDWDYLQNNAVPRINEQGFLDINKILEDIIKKTII